MSRIILIVAIIMSLTECATNTSMTEKDLNNAYSKNSKENLNEFLLKWQNQTSNNLFIENDTIQEIYNVFQLFYFPLNLDSFNSNGAYFGSRNLPYIIAPGKITYAICTQEYPLLYDQPDSKADILEQLYRQKLKNPLIIIDEFRPTINSDSSVVLYLNQTYLDIFENFLGPPTINAEKNDEAFSKIKWLKETCGIIIRYHSYSGIPDKKGEWIIESAPQVQYMFFNESLQKAVIYFMIDENELGVANFEKNNGIWKRTYLFLECLDCE